MHMVESIRVHLHSFAASSPFLIPAADTRELTAMNPFDLIVFDTYGVAFVRSPRYL